MGTLLELAGRMLHDPTSPDWQLAAFGIPADQLQLGAMIYAVLAWIGGPMLAMLAGRQSSGRLWSLLIMAAGLVPYLALRYPVIFGGILPWGLLFAFRRWGFWRILIGLAGLLLFVSILWGRIQGGGYDFGLAFFEALTTTGWLLLGGFLIYVFQRAVFGHHRLAYIGGAVRREEFHANQRTETKRFRAWRNRRLQRAGKAVKEGETYKGKHAPGRAGGSDNPQGDPDTETVDAPMGGAERPATFDPYDDGTTVDGQPISGYQLGGDVRLPLHQRIWRRP
jgi:hypothetical protein